MGRWKYQASLKFFLRYTSYLRGLLVQSTECLTLFFILNSSQVHCWSGTAVADDIILVGQNGEQHSLFFLFYTTITMTKERSRHHRVRDAWKIRKELQFYGSYLDFDSNCKIKMCKTMREVMNTAWHFAVKNYVNF